MKYKELVVKIKKDLQGQEDSLVDLAKSYGMVPQQLHYLILKGQVQPDAKVRTKFKERIMNHGRAR